ncbi:cathepsin L-like proteinase [Chironomus tepperi]|uniref:cathepsin L-like proteinase n=1 Tax=Chironomus tepperi TaxID=113505 RepID=UPI00391EF7B2
MPEKKWNDYKLEHNKNYSETEDAERFEIFKKTLARIEEHNAKYEKGETTYKMGLNHMSDWKDEEKQGILGLRKPSEQK